MAKILVIEDEEILQTLVSRILADDGHDVVAASNGDEGLAMANTEEPDLIITDMSLPKKTGWDVIKELRGNEATSETPIIALTAHSTSEDRTAAYEAGVSAYEAKPVDAAKLKARIHKLIDQR